MSQRDYFEKDYGVLGVAKDASQADIAKAYRKLARELHPDARPGDAQAESRFKEVSEAYSVLASADKRKEYDSVREMVGSQGFRGFGGFPGGGGASGRGGFGQNVNVEDLLGDLFGQAAGNFGGARRSTASTARKGRDLETDLRLSFADAMAGVTTTLRVAGRAACSVCGGSGRGPARRWCAARPAAVRGSSPTTRGCSASPSPAPPAAAPAGRSPTRAPTAPARAWRAARVRSARESRLASRTARGSGSCRQGEAGSYGGPAGDLYVNVHVEPHELFGRRGEHVTLRVPISFAEAALGARITVPTLDEPVTLRVPAGTETGKTFRVKGKGAPAANGKRGDMLVTVDVAVPRKLTRTQRKMLEDYAATEGDALRRHLDEALSGAP